MLQNQRNSINGPFSALSDCERITCRASFCHGINRSAPMRTAITMYVMKSRQKGWASRALMDTPPARAQNAITVI